MNVFTALLVCLGEINCLEIMNSYLQITTNKLYIYYNFLIVGASESVSVLLIGLQLVSHY